MTAKARHLLGVWNPSYEEDALDAHVAVLLPFAQAYREGKADSDEVYVWWGKLRSPYRQAPLPHLDQILAIDADLQGDDSGERHLYLTDYRSLYVGHLGAITADDILADAGEQSHVPKYYRTLGRPADCWFQLWDLRRVVLDDTTAVMNELRALRNTRYNDQRVSLYGGMVDLPLIVTREDDVSWFGEDVRDRMTEGRYWVEFDAERSGTGEMQRELRDNRFGVRLWGNLDSSARRFIATAEQLFRAHRSDAAFDLGSVIVDFAKACEVQANVVLRQSLQSAPRELRMMNVEGRSRDLVADGPWGLAEIISAIDSDQRRYDFFRQNLTNGDWFASRLPAVLEELREVRNRAAHGKRVDRDVVIRLRNALIGVGSQGHLVELASVEPKKGERR